VRILYLADIRFPLERANGIQSMETCHALASRGHLVSMAVRPDTARPARDPFAFYGLPAIDGLRIETATVAGPPAARRAGYVAFAIGRALGRARQDLIFTRDLALASLLLRVPAALRAPLAYEAHGIASDTAAALPHLVSGARTASAAKLRRLAARDAHVWTTADAYVTITEGLRAELERRFGPRPRVAVVPDGVRFVSGSSSYAAASSPASNLQPPTSAATSPFTIGYAGHLYPWKGADSVIEAIAALPDTRGLIVGGHAQEPDLARVRALAERLSCAGRITFTGLLPPTEVASRLRDADVLVLPNPSSALARDFTSPLKLFEYMAAGRPIVASDLPAIREVLIDGRNAVLVEPGNAQALAAGIRRIEHDRALAERLARQAHEDVAGYTWARRAERLESLFAEALEVRARGARGA
jgi:glycosyltransferase involved in cell wall biosynthesis